MADDAADAKVWFELAPDESSWARSIAPDLYVLKNVPWFAFGDADGKISGCWGYDEGCVDDAWLAL